MPIPKGVILRRSCAGGGSNLIHSLDEALRFLDDPTEVVQVHAVGVVGWADVYRQGSYQTWVVTFVHARSDARSELPRSALGGLDRAYRMCRVNSGRKDPGRDLGRWKRSKKAAKANKSG